jgi:hypothetical protein
VILGTVAADVQHQLCGSQNIFLLAHRPCQIEPCEPRPANLDMMSIIVQGRGIRNQSSAKAQRASARRQCRSSIKR